MAEAVAQEVVRMINRRMFIDALEGILHDIWHLASVMESEEYVFSHRVTNRAAHTVAAFMQSVGRTFIWNCISPDFLFNILIKDVNLSIKLD